MPKLKLSRANVHALRCEPGRQVMYYDQHQNGRGLVLSVNHASKTWYVMHYVKGASRYWKLGRYPDMCLPLARGAALEFKANKAQILAEDHRLKNLSAEDVVAALDECGMQFCDVAEMYLEAEVRGKMRRADEVERIFEHDILPAWEHCVFASIKRSDITELLDNIEAGVKRRSGGRRDGRPSADAAFAQIKRVMSWWEWRDDNYQSPATKMKRRSTSHPRERALEDHELRAVWRACGDTPGFPSIVKFCLLTAQRIGKIIDLQHADIDRNGVWRIRTEKGEKGNAGSLQLPQVVLDIVARQPTYPGNPFVFARAKGGPIRSLNDQLGKIRAKLPEVAHFTIHDLRRSSRTLMEAADIDSNVSERVLGHKLQGMIRTYNVWKYDAKKASALERLAAVIEQIVRDPPPASNVVPIRVVDYPWVAGDRHHPA